MDTYLKGAKDEMGEQKSFAAKFYELKTFTSSAYPSLNKSPLGRTFNNVVRAINELQTLPKLIVMVTDNDLVKYIRSSIGEELLTKQIQRSYNWLGNQLQRSFMTFKEFLPEKAKRQHIPQVLWILPPTHKNFDETDNMKRSIAGQAIRTLVNTKEGMAALQMLKIWDHEDGSNFMRENYRFTTQGLTNYWLSIDSAIRFWCVAISRKCEIKRRIGKKPTNYHQNPYKRNNIQIRRKLPTPPM